MAKKKIDVWLRAYSPLRLGGVYTTVKARMPVIGPYAVGKGFKVYLVHTGAKTVAVDAISGGVIPGDVQEIRACVSASKKSEILAQVTEAATERSGAVRISAAEMRQCLRDISEQA